MNSGGRFSAIERVVQDLGINDAALHVATPQVRATDICIGKVGFARLDVQVGDLQRIFLNEFTPRFNYVAHQGLEQLPGLVGVINPHLQKGPGLGVQGRFPQLFRVHFP